MAVKKAPVRKASGACGRTLKLNPKSAESWRGEGDALDRIGRYEEALEAYDRALELNPKDAIAWNNRGVTLEKMGRRDEAVVCAGKAAEFGEWQK